MLCESAAVSASLNSAYGLVDALRGILASTSCPQWTGTGGDSYRANRDEVVATAQGVLDDIQTALDLMPSFEADIAAAVAGGYGMMPTSGMAGLSGVPWGRR